MNIDIAQPNGFETNAGSFRPGRAAALAHLQHASVPVERTSSTARRTKAKMEARARVKATSKPAETVGPTPERLAKGDIVFAHQVGYRVPHPIERLRDQDKLAPGDSYTGQKLFEAAERLAKLHAGAGLASGAKAQDLTSLVSGSGDVPSSIPLNEQARHCRDEFRRACEMMGWYADFPYRGAGRLVVDVVCYELGIEDAASIHRGPARKDRLLAVGLEVLREGLFILANHWSMFGPERIRIRAESIPAAGRN